MPVLAGGGRGDVVLGPGGGNGEIVLNLGAGNDDITLDPGGGNTGVAPYPICGVRADTAVGGGASGCGGLATEDEGAGTGVDIKLLKSPNESLVAVLPAVVA